MKSQNKFKKKVLTAILWCAVIAALVFSTLQYFGVSFDVKAGYAKTLPFQGRLTNPDGTNVDDGSYDMTFRIYDCASCNSLSLWSEGHTGNNAVSVEDGVFNVLLGTINSIKLDFNSGTYWLEVAVNGETLSPRRQIGGSGYSINSDHLEGYTASDFTLDFVAGNGATTDEALTLNGKVTMNNILDANGAVNLGDGGDAIIINGSSIAFGNSAYTIPTTDGGANQVLMTDGSGSVTWNTVSGSIAGGTVNNSTLHWNGVSWVENTTLRTTGTSVYGSGALTVYSTGAALTLTSATAATWSTSAGLLTIQGAAGITADANGGDLTLDAATGNQVLVTLGGNAGDDLLVDGDTLVVSSDTNNVGINDNTPTYDLDITAGTTRAVNIYNITNDGYGVYSWQAGAGTNGYAGFFNASGNVTGDNYAVRAQAAGSTVTTNNAYGIFASAADADDAYAGYFSTADGDPNSNYSVYATSTGAATTNYGIYSTASGATNNYGGSFIVAGGGGNDYGVYIDPDSSTEYGIYVDSGASTEAGNFQGNLTVGATGGGTDYDVNFYGAVVNGSRFLWDAGTGAVRAGAATGTEWDTIGDYSVAFGYNNESSTDYTVICGGLNNTIGAANQGSFIGGGSGNTANRFYSVVVGGDVNYTDANRSFIGGGTGNSLNSAGVYSAIVAGQSNSVTQQWSFIGSGYSNSITNQYAVIAGGDDNTITADHGTISGGDTNNISGNWSVIGGGQNNTVSAPNSVIPGGAYNTVAGDASFAAGYYTQLTGAADRTFVWGYSAAAETFTQSDSAIFWNDYAAAGTSAIKFGINDKTPSYDLDITAASTRGINVDNPVDAAYGIYVSKTGAGAFSAGVYANNTATATSNRGVMGIVGSGSGTNEAVVGEETGTGTGSHYGGNFYSVGDTGTGIKYGAHAYATGTATTNYGIYAYASGGTANWAGWFNAGDVYIEDDLAINTGSTDPSYAIHVMESFSGAQVSPDYMIAAVGTTSAAATGSLLASVYGSMTSGANATTSSLLGGYFIADTSASTQNPWAVGVEGNAIGGSGDTITGVYGTITVADQASNVAIRGSLSTAYEHTTYNSDEAIAVSGVVTVDGDINDGSIQNIYGIKGWVDLDSDDTLSNNSSIMANHLFAFNSGTVSSGNFYGLQAQASGSGTFNSATVAGLYAGVDDYSGSGTWLLSDAYAIYAVSDPSNSGTNIGIYASAANGTSNYAAIFDDGYVGIGDTTPQRKLDIDAGTILGTLDAIYAGGTGTANASLDFMEIAFSVGNMDGGDTKRGLVVNLTDGTYSGMMTPNNLYGIDIIKNAAQSANANEYGIRINDSGWDYGIYSVPDVYFTASTFLGDTSTYFDTSGDQYLDQYIYHTGDTNTYWSFTDTDDIEIYAGGYEFVHMDGDAATKIIDFNEPENDVDFRIRGDSYTDVFYVDAANNNVGFGTATPTAAKEVQVYRDQDAATSLEVRNQNNGNSAEAALEVTGESSYLAIGATSTTFTAVGGVLADSGYMWSGNGNSAGMIFWQVGNNDISFYTNSNEAMEIEGDQEIWMPYVYADDISAKTTRDLYIADDGQLGQIVSSRRYKDNIVDMENTDWLYELRPVNFEYKKAPGQKQYGLIAEEVYEINPYFTTPDEQGAPETVRYSEFISPLLAAVQEHERRLNELTVGGEGGSPIEGESFVGDLAIDGNLDVSETIKVASVWSQNATWHIDSQGELFVQNVQTQDIEIAEGENKAVGTAKIPAGQNEIVIPNTSVTNQSVITLTIGHARAEAKLIVDKPLKIKTVNPGQNFVVGTGDDQPAGEDVPFGYLIIN